MKQTTTEPIFSCKDFENKVQHWARTPENGYLGSSYGGHSILKMHGPQPWSKERAAKIITKFLADLVIKDHSQSISVQWKMIDKSNMEFVFLVGNCKLSVQVQAT